MKHYIKLELQKYKLGRYIAVSTCAILCSMLFVSVSLIDSATDPTQSKDTFDTIFQMIEVLLSFIYIVFYGVLISSMILKEYNTKTILIMFSYPVDRKKLIGAKLLIISTFTALSLFAGYVFCCGYVIAADRYANLLSGSFTLTYLTKWIIHMLTTILVCECIGVLTFAAGMIKQSVSFTIVASILFIMIRQIALSSAYGYTEHLLQSFILMGITFVCLSYTLTHKINQLEF